MRSAQIAAFPHHRCTVLSSAASSAADPDCHPDVPYTAAVETFTVPAGITLLTLQLNGGEGGQGGDDASGPSPAAAIKAS